MSIQGDRNRSSASDSETPEMEDKKDPPWFGCLFVGAFVAAAASLIPSCSDKTETVDQNTPAQSPSSAGQPIADASDPVSTTSTAGPASIGSTMLEQAILDAFPTKAPRSAAERRKTANAADYVASAINSKGHLCAKPVEMRLAAPGQYGIGCVKYRSGEGAGIYLVDSRTGSVDEL